MADVSGQGEHCMKIHELFLGQLEREAPLTRRALERVPAGREDWKPHEKSMPFGYLSTLVAQLPGWAAMVIKDDHLDLNPPGGSPPTKAFHTSAELVAELDRCVAESREALAGTNDDHLMKPWRLLRAGKLLSEDPRHVVLSDAVFSHLAHHRAQLGVYLRLSGIEVPGVYGPSADDHR